MTVRLRPATPSDWPAIAALLEQYHLPLDGAAQHLDHFLVLLTITAGEFFSRFGFTPMARGEVPAALLASAEFTGACPSSAFVMHRAVGRAELP